LERDIFSAVQLLELSRVSDPSSFDEFLKEEGIYQEVCAAAANRNAVASYSPATVFLFYFSGRGMGRFFEQGIEMDEEFAHDGGKGHFMGFALGHEALIEGH